MNSLTAGLHGINARNVPGGLLRGLRGADGLLTGKYAGARYVIGHTDAGFLAADTGEAVIAGLGGRA
jgi:hypothetical protein